MRGLGGEVFAHHPGRRRILVRGEGAKNGTILTRESLESTQKRPKIARF